MNNSKWLVRLLGCFIVILLALPVAVSAKDGGGDFSREELTQMLAPVALYPDALLSQVLMAATYPLEVVAADRWIKRQPLLKGDNLDEALRDQDWDASVKALCHVPAVLGLMSERLEETTRLGDAFLAQEKQVMDIIQELRLRAMREGNLQSDDKQKVTIQEDGTIVIESADPQTVYVPYYNTRYVYGSWWYPAWPPWYWGPGEVVIGPGIYFWPDFYFGFGFGFGYWSHFDWYGRTIIIDAQRRPRFYRPEYDWDSRRGSWRHEPRHRLGVVYRDRSIAERFGQPPERVMRAERQSSRDQAVRGPVSVGGRSTAVADGYRKTGVRSEAGEAAGRQVRGKTGSVSVEKAGPPAPATPRVEPARPVRESRGRGNVGSRETTRTREVVPDRQGDAGDNRSERRGGFGRGGSR